MIDPAERAALLDALARFESAYVDVAQAANRILRLLDMEAQERGLPVIFSPEPARPQQDDRQKDSRPEVAAQPVLASGKIDPQPIAKAKAVQSGYLGDPCGQCGLFMLVRVGTCIRCNSCGWDTGCG